MTPEQQQHSWYEYRIHVMASLNELKDTNDRVEAKLDHIERELTILKVKAGVWGLAGATLPIILLIGSAWAKGLL